ATLCSRWTKSVGARIDSVNASDLRPCWHGDAALLHQRLFDLHDLRVEDAESDSEILARRISMDVVVIPGGGARDGGCLFINRALRARLRSVERSGYRRDFLDLQNLFRKD